MTIYERATLKSRTVVTVEDGWYGGPFAVVRQDVPGSSLAPRPLHYTVHASLDVAQAAFQRLVAPTEAQS